LATVQYSAVSGEDFIVGDVWGFTRDGREYAVISRTEAGVSIVDVTSPTQPVIVSNVDIPAGGNQLFHSRPYNGYIYAVMRPGPLQIIDARDPNNAFEVKQYSTGFNQAYVLFISDSTAYLADVDSDRQDVNLIVLDISDPENPVEVGTWSRTYHHIFVRNDTLIGFVQKGEVDFLDVSDPSDIQLIFNIGSTGTKTHSGWLNDAGDLLSLEHETPGGHLALWDVNPLNSAYLLSEYSTSSNYEGETSTHHSRWYFDLLYISYWQDCLRIIDASDPNNLQEVAVYDTIQPNPYTLYRGFWGIYPYAPSRNIYVSDPKTGLIILDYVNDGPGIRTNEVESIPYYGDSLRGEFTKINGSKVDSIHSYVYYRSGGSSDWQRQLIFSQGKTDSFYFKIPLTSDADYTDYYLQISGVNGKKTRAPGLAPSLDFYRFQILSSQANKPQIYISEISDATNPDNSFMEIYNTSSESVNLSTAKIVRCSAGVNSQYQTGAYVFDFGSDESSVNLSTTIPANGFLIVACGSDQSTFEAEWGTLPQNANYNSGNANLAFGQGNGTRWTLLAGGNQDTFDGVLIDSSPTNAGGDGTVSQQLSPGNWQISPNRSDATPGYLANDQSLPVSLQYFSAEFRQNKLHLKWETASEVNNLGFRILKKRSTANRFKLLAGYENTPGLRGSGSSSAGRIYRYVDGNIISGATYNYLLQDVSINGSVQNLDTIEVRIPKTNELAVNYPGNFELYQNFPNPFNEQTKIRIKALNGMTSAPLTLQVFNTNGLLIKEFSVNLQPSAIKEFIWNGRNNKGKPMPSGIYYLRAKSGQQTPAIKMLLVR